MRTGSGILAFAPLAGLVVLAAVAASGCVANERSAPPLPSKESFVTGNVSLFLELRCGSLDCHGQVGRPLRLYSKNGLRLAKRDDDVTDEERTANYHAVVGLEPDELSLSLATKGAFTDFLLLKKPLDESGGGVKHKGGPVLQEFRDDPGWVCLSGWVSGNAAPDECKKAATVNTNGREP